MSKVLMIPKLANNISRAMYSLSPLPRKTKRKAATKENIQKKIKIFFKS